MKQGQNKIALPGILLGIFSDIALDLLIDRSFLLFAGLVIELG